MKPVGASALNQKRWQSNERNEQTARLLLHLWNPQGTADVDPLGSTPGRLHGSALLRTQLAFGQDTEGTDPAEPAALGDLLNAVTRLGGGRQFSLGAAHRQRLQIKALKKGGLSGCCSDLMHADVALITEHHLIVVLAVR